MSYEVASSRVIKFSVILMLLTATALGAPQRAQAWLLEPQPSQKSISDDDRKLFEKASSQVLQGAALIYEALRRAESQREPISKESLEKADGALKDGAAIFDKLASSSLGKVQLNWKALDDKIPGLAGERGRAERYFKLKLTNGAELAQMLGTATQAIVQSVEKLKDSKLGPTVPLDADGRQALHDAVDQIGIFTRVANAGAVALSLAE